MLLFVRFVCFCFSCRCHVHRGGMSTGGHDLAAHPSGFRLGVCCFFRPLVFPCCLYSLSGFVCVFHYLHFSCGFVLFFVYFSHFQCTSLLAYVCCVWRIECDGTSFHDLLPYRFHEDCISLSKRWRINTDTRCAGCWPAERTASCQENRLTYSMFSTAWVAPISLFYSTARSVLKDWVLWAPISSRGDSHGVWKLDRRPQHDPWAIQISGPHELRHISEDRRWFTRTPINETKRVRISHCKSKQIHLVRELKSRA